MGSPYNGIVFEPGIRHWCVQTNGRNSKFISNLTAAHQALQISSISGGTTIVSAPIMSSYQELLEFGLVNLQLACPGIIITEQSATGKGINNCVRVCLQVGLHVIPKITSFPKIT